jgi:DNA polymerase-1
MDIPKSKLDSIDLPTEAKFILRNIRNKDRPVSLLVAAELYDAFPLIATQLELHRPILYNQYFVPVDSILDIGETYCYDLEVENTHTYISNGFVSHNSQIELRVVAEIIYNLSGDRKMLDEFLDGKDPYLATAALMAGLDYDSMIENGKPKPAYKSLRQNAKAVRLGYNYGMGWRKFRTYAKISYGVSMTLEEAQANRQLYFTSYPGLQVYHDTFASKDTNVAYSLPPFNRPRYFDRYPGIPALANHPVQSTSADIQKLAQAMMFEDLHSKGFSPVGSHKMRQLVTIHDEIVSEATDEYVEECKHIQQKAMEDAAKVVLSLCPVEAEADCIINLALKG